MKRFQMYGDVSDDSAVLIGHFLGADVVITGTITGTGDQRRLRLRALNVINNLALRGEVCCLGKVFVSGFNTSITALKLPREAGSWVLNPSQTIKNVNNRYVGYCPQLLFIP
jgi:hypothetical protein